MKKEIKTKDPFDTESSFFKIMDDPYMVFSELFTVADISHFRKTIKKLVLFAGINKVYKIEAPRDFLYDLRLLNSVLKAAHYLREIKKSPIEVLESDLFNKKYYCRNMEHSEEWEEFPRYLSKKEYCNPYLVFKRMFKYQDLDQWIVDLTELGEYAMSTDRVEPGLDMISIHSYLSKMVEAAHIIDVREVTHVDGRLKNR
ncbi:MAG: hypothetical protein JST58_12730 [Bacteroidetes bacterium]|jgi:hypothetical protein|nr:hypothetical protein [Bacteroidota bacterium]